MFVFTQNQSEGLRVIPWLKQHLKKFFLVMMTHEGTDVHISDLTLERKLRHGTNGIITWNVLSVMEHFSPTSLHYYICIKVCFYSVVSSLSSNYCEL